MQILNSPGRRTSEARNLATVHPEANHFIDRHIPAFNHCCSPDLVFNSRCSPNPTFSLYCPPDRRSVSFDRQTGFQSRFPPVQVREQHLIFGSHSSSDVNFHCLPNPAFSHCCSPDRCSTPIVRQIGIQSTLTDRQRGFPPVQVREQHLIFGSHSSSDALQLLLQTSPIDRSRSWQRRDGQEEEEEEDLQPPK